MIAAPLALALVLLTGDPTVPAQTVKIMAKRFEYVPNEITLKKGVPAVLELVSSDRRHGFHIHDLRIREDVMPGQSVFVRFTPEKAGRFAFECDVFCGTGHEEMSGVIVVVE